MAMNPPKVFVKKKPAKKTFQEPRDFESFNPQESMFSSFPYVWSSILIAICGISSYSVLKMSGFLSSLTESGMKQTEEKLMFGSKQILVFKNGENSEGVVVVLNQHTCGSSLELDFVQAVSKLLYADEPVNPCEGPPPAWASGPSLSCRAFDRFGRRVKSCAAAAALSPGTAFFQGKLVYVTPPGREFIWPTVELGHKETISHIVTPTALPMVMETISINPRIFHIHGFLSDQEAHSLIMNVQEGPDNSLKSPTWFNSDVPKTSESGFDFCSSVSLDIKRRASRLLGIEMFDEMWMEGIQVDRYEEGGANMQHLDYLGAGTNQGHNFNPATGGTNRQATVIMFLSDVEAGGEVVFPEVLRHSGASNESPGYFSNVKGANQKWEENLSQECLKKLVIKPVKGDAILFYSQHPNGSFDALTMQGSCPVLSGSKWSANLWVWNGPRVGYSSMSSKLADQTRKTSLHNPNDPSICSSR